MKTDVSTQKDEVVIVIGWKQIVLTIMVVCVGFASWKFLVDNFSPGIKLSTDKADYRAGDTVRIEGWIRESWFAPLASEPVAIEVRSSESVIWIDQVNTDLSGYFASSFRLRNDSVAGIYHIYTSVEYAQGSITFSVRT